MTTKHPEYEPRSYGEGTIHHQDVGEVLGQYLPVEQRMSAIKEALLGTLVQLQPDSELLKQTVNGSDFCQGDEPGEFAGQSFKVTAVSEHNRAPFGVSLTLRSLSGKVYQSSLTRLGQKL